MLRPYVAFGVPKGGLEPPRACAHWLLKPARLPVPPLRRRFLRNGNLERCITPSQCVSCRRRVEKISIARNPKARHDYHLLETWEAGLVLTGTEVKSLRDRKASLNEAYAHVRNGEVWLEGMRVSDYWTCRDHNAKSSCPPTRLHHKREIRKL